MATKVKTWERCSSRDLTDRQSPFLAISAWDRIERLDHQRCRKWLVLLRRFFGKRKKPCKTRQDVGGGWAVLVNRNGSYGVRKTYSIFILTIYKEQNAAN